MIRDSLGKCGGKARQLEGMVLQRWLECLGEQHVGKPDTGWRGQGTGLCSEAMESQRVIEEPQTSRVCSDLSGQLGPEVGEHSGSCCRVRVKETARKKELRNRGQRMGWKDVSSGTGQTWA